VLGISDIVEHPNTHYNAATMAFEYNNASSAETPPLLLPPISGKQTHLINMQQRGKAQ
jgi:hypothetical protein